MSSAAPCRPWATSEERQHRLRPQASHSPPLSLPDLPLPQALKPWGLFSLLFHRPASPTIQDHGGTRPAPHLVPRLGSLCVQSLSDFRISPASHPRCQGTGSSHYGLARAKSGTPGTSSPGQQNRARRAVGRPQHPKGDISRGIHGLAGNSRGPPGGRWWTQVREWWPRAAARNPSLL